jgi:hypothetical protein
MGQQPERLSAEAAAESHGQKVKELESSHVDKQNELSEEMRRIAVELRVRDLARNSVAIYSSRSLEPGNRSMQPKQMLPRQNTENYFKLLSNVQRSVSLVRLHVFPC